jgi:hypothetical protein
MYVYTCMYPLRPMLRPGVAVGARCSLVYLGPSVLYSELTNSVFARILAVRRTATQALTIEHRDLDVFVYGRKAFGAGGTVRAQKTESTHRHRSSCARSKCGESEWESAACGPAACAHAHETTTTCAADYCTAARAGTAHLHRQRTSSRATTDHLVRPHHASMPPAPRLSTLLEHPHLSALGSVTSARHLLSPHDSRQPTPLIWGSRSSLHSNVVHRAVLC